MTVTSKLAHALLCVDVEPDTPAFGGRRRDYFGPQKWEGIEKGIPRFLELRHGIQESLDCEIPVNWFFRSDRQIAEMCGTAAWALRSYRSMVDILLQQGDEVGWHAHTWQIGRAHV